MSRRSDELLDRAAPLFAALGDATRLHVLKRLSSDGPLSIRELTEGSEVTRQAMTRHLDVLAAAGAVSDFRRGRERIWELETKELARAQRALDLVSQRWDRALERLRLLVES